MPFLAVSLSFVEYEREFFGVGVAVGFGVGVGVGVGFGVGVGVAVGSGVGVAVGRTISSSDKSELRTYPSVPLEVLTSDQSVP